MIATTAGPRAVISGRFGKLEVVPFDGAMGAEIRGLDLRALDDESFRVLYQAYLDHVLVLGRVTTGEGGDLILAAARRVLETEFPALAERVRFHTPDEKDKRHGQAVAAASLPVLPR